MAEYDFSTLSSTDFEELVCDLLNAEEQVKGSPIRFHTYRVGKDKGVDFRYSSASNNNMIIGQVKHYWRSGLDQLLRVLKNDELPKVNKLKPEKYILATSLDLSVGNADDIRKLMSPHIKSTNDIYGLKDLNSLIEQHHDILQRHFKLWYCSTNVLRKILHYEIEGRSNEFIETELKKKLRLYVPTDVLIKTRDVLEKNNFVIITGDPGAGKTTTAEFLLYDLIRQDYELVYIHDNVREVESKITPDDKKQVFYFDDFLGHNSVEIAKAKGSETALIKILKRASRGRNKRFILTTRTFILNTAVEESERLRQFNIKAKESTIELSHYTERIKCRLLNNHIDECQFSDYLITVLRDEKIYSFIVNHKNFSPRSVEFVTFNETIADFSADEFRNFIEHNFNSPDEIWRHAYEQQINEIDRLLLNTAISFGNSMLIEELEVAFNERLNYEVRYNNLARPLNAFKTSFRKLEGGFIVQNRHYPEWCEFINPSLTDFLLNYLRNSRDEVIRISESAYYLKQLTTRMFCISGDNNGKYRMAITDRLRERLFFQPFFYVKDDTQNFDRLTLAILIHKFFDLSMAEPIVQTLLKQVSDWKFLNDDHDISFFLESFLNEVKSENIIQTVREVSSGMFFSFVIGINDLSKIIEIIKSTGEKFKVDYSVVFSSGDIDALAEKITCLLEEQIEQDIADLLEYSHAQDFVDGKEQNISDIVKYFSGLGLITKPNFSPFSSYDWQAVGIENYFIEQMQKDD